VARNKSNEVSREDKKEQIRLLETQLAALKGESPVVDEDIKMTDYVRVMSLFAGHLNLSTQERGKGKVFRFEDFGAVKRMIYSELVDVLEAYSKFAEAGYFIVLDQRVIRNHGLEDAYAKILTKEKIDRITAGSPDAADLFAACNIKQQAIIISMMVEKLRDNPEAIDLNVVDKISRLSKIDIVKKARESREFFELDKQENAAEGELKPTPVLP
jgi:hypothetical protein